MAAPRGSGRAGPGMYEPGDIGDRTQKVEIVHITSLKKVEDCLVLIYTEGPDLGKRFDLKGAIVSVGRDPDNDIFLDEETVSRRHAKFEKKGGRTCIIDLESTNGTYLNDARLEPLSEHTLGNGDKVKVGRSIFKYLSGDATEASYYEEIHRMAIMDGLTGLFNKRYLTEALDRESARAKRYGRPLALIMIDLDHFKNVNDSFGHLAGDHVLKEVGEIFRSRVRREEIVARYGGEEFAIILPETDKAGALAVAEQMRQKVEGHVFTFSGRKIRLTISAGVSEVSEGRHDFKEFLRIADERLYASKHTGRNRTSDT